MKDEVVLAGVVCSVLCRGALTALDAPSTDSRPVGPPHSPAVGCSVRSCALC